METQSKWYEDSLGMAEYMTPYVYFKNRIESHNFNNHRTYARFFIRRSKYIGWAMVLNND